MPSIYIKDESQQDINAVVLIDPTTGEYYASNQTVIAAGSSIIGKVGIDQTTPGTTDSVTTKPVGHEYTVTITRPADTTPYTALDVIGSSSGSAIFEFLNMGKAGGQIIITSIELEVGVASVPSGMTTFTCELFNASPTAIADNAPFALVSGDSGKYKGDLQLVPPKSKGAFLFSSNDNLDKQMGLVSTSLFVELKTDTAYTPSSGAVKKLTIHTIEV